MFFGLIPKSSPPSTTLGFFKLCRRHGRNFIATRLIRFVFYYYHCFYFDVFVFSSAFIINFFILYLIHHFHFSTERFLLPLLPCSLFSLMLLLFFYYLVYRVEYIIYIFSLLIFYFLWVILWKLQCPICHKFNTRWGIQL